jgi:hypothetical protein
MKRIMSAIGFSAMLACSQASNAQPQSRAVLAKHQLSECMSKRMAADKNVSYNQAMRACKEQLQPPKDTLASNDSGEAGTKAR